MMRGGIRTFLSVFFLFNLFLSSFYLDDWKNANTTSRALPIVTFFESGTFRIDKYHEMTVDKALVNGHYYTDKAPLPTFVVIPFFGLLKATGLIEPDGDGNLFGDHVYLLGGFLTASLPFAALVLFLFIEIRKPRTSVSPVLLATIPFIASFVFVFTGTYFAHIFSAVLLLACYLLLRKHQYLLAGFAGGLAFLSEYSLAIILLFWGILVLVHQRKVKPFVHFSLGILPSLVFLVYYNARFSSSPFTFMYKHHNFSELDANYGFVFPTLESFWGLSFSPYRGVLFFAPFLVAVFYIIYRRVGQGQWISLLTGYLTLPFAGYFIFISSYFAWWGGWTYGPRLLLAPVLILIYRMIEHFSFMPFSRTAFAVLSAVGLMLILPAKGTIAYSAPTGVMNPFVDLVVEGIRTGNYNPNNLATMFFGVDPGNAFIIFMASFLLGFSLLTLWYRRWQEI